MVSAQGGRGGGSPWTGVRLSEDMLGGGDDGGDDDGGDGGDGVWKGDLSSLVTRSIERNR